MDIDKLEPRERDAVLAGLRLLEAWRTDRVASRSADLDVAIDDIESSGGEHDVLEADDIDALCERINCGGDLALVDVAA